MSLTDELLNSLAAEIERLTLLPSSGGRFEVTVNDELVYSKLATGRHAEPGEIKQLVEHKAG